MELRYKLSEEGFNGTDQIDQQTATSIFNYLTTPTSIKTDGEQRDKNTNKEENHNYQRKYDQAAAIVAYGEAPQTTTQKLTNEQTSTTPSLLNPAFTIQQMQDIIGSQTRQKTPENINGGITLADINAILDKNYKEREDEQKKIEKKAKQAKNALTIARIGDALTAMSNLYFTYKGARSNFEPEKHGLTGKAKKRYEKLIADYNEQNEKRRNNYYKDLFDLYKEYKNKRQFDANLGERQRQFDANLGERQRQFDANLEDEQKRTPNNSGNKKTPSKNKTAYDAYELYNPEENNYKTYPNIHAAYNSLPQG